jgi:hypothetical protein
MTVAEFSNPASQTGGRKTQHGTKVINKERIAVDVHIEKSGKMII